MKTIAYARISTSAQDEAAQKLAVERYCQSAGMRIDKWVSREISSRKDTRQRGIDELLAGLRKGDTLIVSELSRLARSVGEVATICDSLLQKRVRLICVKEGIDLQKNGKDLDIASQVQVTMFSLFASIERSIISMRTKEGLAAARSKGVKLGNPNLEKMNRRAREDATDFAEQYRGQLRDYLEQEMNYTQIAWELNREGIKARMGGRWTAFQVEKMVKRLVENQ